MKIKLLGNHSRYHCGSVAVWDVLSGVAVRHGEIVEDGSFDLLVVNGEGSMHHGSPGCVKKLMAIDEAVSAGRRAMLINTVWQDNPPELADMLRGCERICAREALSARALERAGIRAEVFLDLSYFSEIADVEPYDFRGGVVITDFWSREFDTFAKVTGKWTKEYHYVDMQEWEWSQLVRSLRTASLLITGRHHGVFAACKAEIPFVALKGNTHKIEGLGVSSDIAIPVFDTLSGLREALTEPTKLASQCYQLYDWMRRQPTWRIG